MSGTYLLLGIVLLGICVAGAFVTTGVLSLLKCPPGCSLEATLITDTVGDVYEDGVEFMEHLALAHLLINEVVFLNSYWWERAWPEKARAATSLNVDCSDVFAWGCSDAESLRHGQIESLYQMWRKDPDWGAAVWCMIKRNKMPQAPVEKIIREKGIWDLDALKLGGNKLEAEVTAFFSSLRTAGRAQAHRSGTNASL